MRVATFNILHGSSVPDGRVDPSLLRAAAEELDADVLGLQEVDHFQPRSGNVDQTAIVAAALGAQHWRCVPALLGTPGESWTVPPGDDNRHPVLRADLSAADAGPAYGVGLVSRLPITGWAVRRFGPAPVGMPLMAPGHNKGLVLVDDEPRVAVAAQVQTATGALTVITTHLSFVPGWNVAQLRALARWARALPGPRLLLGDLNLPGAVPRLTTRWAEPAKVATYPSWRPRVQLDHVLLDGIPARAVRGVQGLRLPVSDHRALLVDVDGF